MANLQIKNIDDDFYNQIKELATAENRSVSQQIVHLTRQYLAASHAQRRTRSAAAVLLDLCGSWESEKSAAEIAEELRQARVDSARLKDGF